MLKRGTKKTQRAAKTPGSSSLYKECLEAFRTQPPTEKQLALIRMVAENPGTPAVVLSDMVWGRGESSGFQMHFGKICRDRQSFFVKTQPEIFRDGPFWSGLLVETRWRRWRDGRNLVTFTLKPPVLRALRELGYLPHKS